MTTTARPHKGRALAFLTALIAVWAVLFTAQPASGLTPATAENRVGASASSLQNFVGPPGDVSAGQSRFSTALGPETAVATGVAANSGSSARGVIDDVFDETTSHTGAPDLTSAHSLSQDEALDGGIRWLGDGYTEIGKPGSGVFRSNDGLLQFRMDSGSITGGHAPRPGHVHFEIYEPGARKPIVNNHVPLDFGR